MGSTVEEISVVEENPFHRRGRQKEKDRVAPPDSVYPFEMKFNFNITLILECQHIISTFKYNGGINYLRKNYGFEKLTIFHCMNFRQNLTYNSRGAWHTLYAMLPSN